MTQQAGNLSNAERAVSSLLGTALAFVAARRGNPVIRALAGTASAALLARAYAGHCAMKAVATGQTSLAGGIADQWRRMSSTGRSDTLSRAAASSAVDESLDQSFPASDPPASRLPDEPPVNAEAKWRAVREAEG